MIISSLALPLSFVLVFIKRISALLYFFLATTIKLSADWMNQLRHCLRIPREISCFDGKRFKLSATWIITDTVQVRWLDKVHQSIAAWVLHRKSFQCNPIGRSVGPAIPRNRQKMAPSAAVLVNLRANASSDRIALKSQVVEHLNSYLLT